MQTLSIGMPESVLVKPSPRFNICSCIADLQSQALGSLGLARAIAGTSSSGAQTQRSQEARGGWVAQPSNGLSPKVRTARRPPPLQRVNSVTIGSSKSPVLSHTANERLTPSPGKGVTPKAPALHTPPVGRARKPEVKKPEQRTPRNYKTQHSFKEAVVTGGRNLDEENREEKEIRKEIKELSKKIFVEEHLTERDFFWRETRDKWVSLKRTGYVNC